MPFSVTELDYSAEFSRKEFDQIILGFVPETMEDKWFIYFEDSYLCFHRSWTGICVFKLKFEINTDKIFVSEAILNSELDTNDLRYQLKLIDYLIQNMLLNRNTLFPVPGKGLTGALKGLFQHHITGDAGPAKRRKQSYWGWLWK